MLVPSHRTIAWSFVVAGLAGCGSGAATPTGVGGSAPGATVSGSGGASVTGTSSTSSGEGTGGAGTGGSAQGGTGGAGGASSTSSTSSMSSTSSASSTSSTSGGGQVCTAPGTCPGVDDACQHRTCLGGQCGMAFSPSGTLGPSQTPGDCKKQVCDGAGAVITVPDTSDVVDDGNACTLELCDAQGPSHPFKAAGAACAQGGGTVCDGQGTCVECVTGANCASGVCAQNHCASSSCADGVKNGGETSVDCGGAACVPCTAGKGCSKNTDCADGSCVAGACTAICAATTGKDGGESASVVTSCAIPGVPAATAVNLASDVTYTTPGGVEVKLDVAWPKAPGLHPLVMFIHGGSWYGGTKALYTQDMLRLASIGYVASAIDYRSTKYGYTFPAEEADTRCAIRFLRAHASSYQIDPARVGVIGDSAGAHLAAQLGVQSDDTTLDDGTCTWTGSPKPNVVVAYYGIYDLTSSSALGTLVPKASAFLDGAPEQDLVKSSHASPLLHVDSCDTTFLFTVGTSDSLVPPQQSYTMESTVRAAGIPATLVTIPGADHGFAVFATGQTIAASCTTLGFLAARLGP